MVVSSFLMCFQPVRFWLTFQPFCSDTSTASFRLQGDTRHCAQTGAETRLREVNFGSNLQFWNSMVDYYGPWPILMKGLFLMIVAALRRWLLLFFLPLQFDFCFYLWLGYFLCHDFVCMIATQSFHDVMKIVNFLSSHQVAPISHRERQVWIMNVQCPSSWPFRMETQVSTVSYHTSPNCTACNNFIIP